MLNSDLELVESSGVSLDSLRTKAAEILAQFASLNTAETQSTNVYRSIKQLLGDNYKLLNRQQQQKHSLSHQRQIAQTLAAPNQFGESELGQYVDSLLAKEIIAIAQTYSAGSIVC